MVEPSDYDGFSYREARDDFDGVRILYRDSERQMREARYPDVELENPFDKRLPTRIGVTTTLLKAIAKAIYELLSTDGMNKIEFDYHENGTKLSLGRAIELSDTDYMVTSLGLNVQDGTARVSARRLSS